MNGDGVLDMVVCAYGDDDGGTDAGAVYILFLATSGTVLSHQKVSATHGGFTGSLASGDYFGTSSGVGGDLNGDGVLDMVVGAYRDDDGGYDAGGVFFLFLVTSGNVLSHQKVSATHGGFTGNLASNDRFGVSCGGIGGDLNGDGVLDMVVGASGDDDGGSWGHGAVYIILLDGNTISVRLVFLAIVQLTN